MSVAAAIQVLQVGYHPCESGGTSGGRAVIAPQLGVVRYQVSDALAGSLQLGLSGFEILFQGVKLALPIRLLFLTALSGAGECLLLFPRWNSKVAPEAHDVCLRFAQLTVELLDGRIAMGECGMIITGRSGLSASAGAF